MLENEIELVTGMKTLLLVRHAKSSWKDSQLADHDRPLNGRGRRAAPEIGAYLRAESLIPDQILCSTAIRARETVQRMFGESLDLLPPIRFVADLYLASPAQIVKILQAIEEPIRRVMVIGHNPGFEELIELLTGQVERFPTAAVAQIAFETKSWSELQLIKPCGKLLKRWRP